MRPRTTRLAPCAREHLEQQIVDDAVHGAGHADAEREREPDDGDQPGASPQGTDSDPNVAQEVTREMCAPLTGRVLLVHAAKGASRAIDIPELAERLRARRRPLEAGSTQLLGPRVDVKRELGIDVGGNVGAPEMEIAMPFSRSLAMIQLTDG